VLKRTFDICFSLFGIFISLPLWLLLSLLILIKEGRPVFFLQERAGKGGLVFKSFKFRSMIRDAEKDVGPVQAKENDARITGVGSFLRKSAMDELPQLMNIYKGEMSFVGPRALRPFEIELHACGDPEKDIESLLHSERSKIVPGLTGVAQVFAPRDVPRAEKFKYDVWYVKNRKFVLDLELIFLSFIITFLGKWEVRKEKICGLGIYSWLQTKITREI